MRIQDLPNLGEKSAAMLLAAGVDSIKILRELGAVECYRRVKKINASASLNLLWALEAALTNRRWQDVAREDRLSLLTALEVSQRQHSLD